MNRRDFLALSSALAAAGCAPRDGRYWDFDVRFSGKAVVVGAGASGLAAGYLLDRYGVDFEILEANDRIGGRVKRLDGFADFPIDAGAEWIHQDPVVLSDLVDDPDAKGAIDVVPYSPESLANYTESGQLLNLNFASNYYSEYKFRNTTWYGFLEERIAASYMDRIRLSTPIADIDHSGGRIVLHHADGGTTEADRVLVTVPLKILQEGVLTFTPELSAKKKAWDRVGIPAGLKVFLEFDEKFYPDITVVGPVLQQDQIYYDAAFRKGAKSHVLALFWVSNKAKKLIELDSDEAILEAVLDELDAIFDGQASKAYKQGFVQNWSKEPYALGSYSVFFEGDRDDIIETLREPVDDRLFFSGEALSRYNWATVPGAMQSGYNAVRTLLETP